MVDREMHMTKSEAGIVRLDIVVDLVGRNGDEGVLKMEEVTTCLSLQPNVMQARARDGTRKMSMQLIWWESALMGNDGWTDGTARVNARAWQSRKAELEETRRAKRGGGNYSRDCVVIPQFWVT